MTKLKKSLSFLEALSIVVGSMIGTGVFLKSATMGQLTGSTVLVFLAWIVAGVLSLAGAVTYSEMGRRHPNAGGEYVYLRESYGPLPAFLYGWTRFWIASTGSVAAYGVGAATLLSGAISIERLGGTKMVALFFIAFYTLANCFAVSLGGKLQAAMTVVKVLMIVTLIVVLGVFSSGQTNLSISYPDLLKGQVSFSAFGMAVISALWAFDGWNNLPMAAGEVKDSERIVPLALVTGTFLVLILYLGINFVFFKNLSYQEVITSNSSLYPNAPTLAAKAISNWIGARSSSIVSFLFVFSALGAMNGSILSGARVPYAMAQDGLFLSLFGRVNPHTQVPAVAVALQGLWAIVLALTGTFDQLTDYVVFTSWIFYSAVAFAVFRLKQKRMFIALVFSILGVVLVINSFLFSPKSSFIGLIFVVLGVPVYRVFVNLKKLNIEMTMKS